VFDRFAARLSYVQGDFGDAATYDRVGAAIKAATRPQGLGIVLECLVHGLVSVRTPGVRRLSV
jgi:hypothetical protein